MNHVNWANMPLKNYHEFTHLEYGTVSRILGGQSSKFQLGGPAEILGGPASRNIGCTNFYVDLQKLQLHCQLALAGMHVPCLY
jgi:hypothetical protein